MADTIVTSVPERLLAVYAVVTSDPPDGDLLPSSGGLAADVVPRDMAPLPASALVRAMGADSATLEAYEAGSHAVLVRAVGTATFPPAHEFAAYKAAQTISDLSGGVLVDTLIPRLVTRPRDVGDDFRLADWMVLPHSLHGSLLWFTSKGLTRFGLSELQSHGIPQPLANAWGAVLTGIAQVLLREHARALAEDPSAALREVPATQEVSLRDIAAAYSDHARFGKDAGLDTAAPFRLELDPATEESADSFLSVLPPDDFGGTPDQWAGEVVRTLFTGHDAAG
ncbi:MAG: hypothetical protein GEU93_22290 [Propionibacteriales bacterium]|nr:hypothetical protein [Propionibacteriales bacterium]